MFWFVGLPFSFGHGPEARPERLHEAIAPCLLQHGQTLRESSKDEQSAKALRGQKQEDSRREFPLLQIDAVHSSTRADRVDPTFFGGFSDAESTFDVDGSEDQTEVQISEAARTDEDEIPTVRPAQWFVETPSAGPKEAWQTYDEESKDASWRASAPEWRELDFGRTKQDWVPVQSRMKSRSEKPPGKEATWFDTSVNQQDYFGRPRAPSPASSQFYLEWSEVKRTAEWSCGPPGCTANTSLKAFENGKMQYERCTLSVMVNPTDFDDEYNIEKIEWIVINGKEAVRDFSPRAPKGCETNEQMGALDSDLEVPLDDPSLLSRDIQKRRNKSSSTGPRKKRNITDLPLYPCIRDLPLEGLVGTDGHVNVSGKISPAVDECPVNGNHLSGLVVMTCFARSTTTIPPSTTTTTTFKAPEQVQEEFKTSDSARFRCKDPGCSAATVLSVDLYNLTSRKCFLTVRVNQTDFDELDGTKERIESVKVNNKIKAADLKPGKNPCHEAIDTGRGRRNNEEATVIDKEDVTNDIHTGLLVLELKITDMVDECAVDGYLLDGEASVSCEGTYL